MPTLAELRHEKDQITAQIKDLMAKHPTNMPADVANRIDAMLSQAERLSGKIEALDQEAQRAGDNYAQQHIANGGWKNSNGEPMKVLRNAADIRSHYAAKHTPHDHKEQPVALDDFLRGVAGMSASDKVKAALSVGTDSTGGYAVPSVVMPGILEALVPASSVLSAGAGIVPLDQGAKSFTTAAVDTIPTAAWRLESGNVANSEPTFRGVIAAPKSLAFLFKVSRELLADSPNLSEALNIAIGQAFAVALDRTALLGTGTNPEPRGLANTAGIINIANGANGAALAGYGNFFAGIQGILQANAPHPTAAIMSPRSLMKLGSLTDQTGQPLRKPEMVEKLNLLSTTAIPDDLEVGTSENCSEIYLGDFTKMNFMMREQVSIQVAKELYAGTGEIGFICHVRADIAVLYPKAFARITGVKA